MSGRRGNVSRNSGGVTIVVASTMTTDQPDLTPGDHPCANAHRLRRVEAKQTRTEAAADSLGNDRDHDENNGEKRALSPSSRPFACSPKTDGCPILLASAPGKFGRGNDERQNQQQL